MSLWARGGAKLFLNKTKPKKKRKEKERNRE
jgi:hypothetical protein